MIDDRADSRRGISVIFRPEGTALEGLKAVQEELRQVVSDQYFPTPDALHVTALSLVSCASDVELNAIDVDRFAQVLQDSLRTFSAFELAFDGLTASPAFVMAQGFTTEGVLGRIRDSLHQGIIKAGLPHTKGHRYPARTAHCTLLRFRQMPSEPDRFIECLNLSRNRPMGSCRITRVSLVSNDWYHRASIPLTARTTTTGANRCHSKGGEQPLGNLDFVDH